jgi:3-oxoacyl-[acyl-carrier-protein] synthase III
VVIRRVSSRLAETPIATAHLIAEEQPDRIFSLRERRQLGIKYVRSAGPTELPSTLAAAAAKDALGPDAAEDIELLATATTTPSDFEMWSLPAKVAQLIGANRAACVGFAETGCAAPFAALHLMRPTMLGAGGPRRALLVAQTPRSPLLRARDDRETALAPCCSSAPTAAGLSQDRPQRLCLGLRPDRRVRLRCWFGPPARAEEPDAG